MEPCDLEDIIFIKVYAFYVSLIAQNDQGMKAFENWSRLQFLDLTSSMILHAWFQAHWDGFGWTSLQDILRAIKN